MKQNQQVQKKTFTILLFFITITITFAQGNFLSKTNINDKGNKTRLCKKLDPTFTKYFKKVKRTNLEDLLKSQATLPHIDSMVSVAYDTSFQKVKNTYEYDVNGYISNFTREYYDEGILLFAENYNLEFRSDGQIKSINGMRLDDGVWRSTSKDNYTYDPSGNKKSSVSGSWDTTSSSWQYNNKHDYTYDANHNMLTDVNSGMYSGAWKNKNKFEWIYEDNKEKTEIYSTWTSGVWENDRKYEWQYEGDNKKIEINSVWHSGVWKNKLKETYSYDGNNNLISENKFDWNLTTTLWENKTWDLYSYNSNNKRTFNNSKKWNSRTSSWEDDDRTTITYNSAQKILSELSEEWEGGAWVKKDQYEFTYDVDNHIQSFINYDNWNGSNWDNKDKLSFTYNSLGQCIGGNSETWFAGHWVSVDAETGLFLPRIFEMQYKENVDIYDEMLWYFTFVQGYEYTVYYKETTDVKRSNIGLASFKLEQNYPNPFNPTTNIQYSIPNNEFVSLKIYNLLGREVTTLVNQNQPAGKYNVNFDASNLTSGIYFYQISTSNFNQVRKMMLVK